MGQVGGDRRECEKRRGKKWDKKDRRGGGLCKLEILLLMTFSKVKNVATNMKQKKYF